MLGKPMPPAQSKTVEVLCERNNCARLAVYPEAHIISTQTSQISAMLSFFILRSFRVCGFAHQNITSLWMKNPTAAQPPAEATTAATVHQGTMNRSAWRKTSGAASTSMYAAHQQSNQARHTRRPAGFSLAFPKIQKKTMVYSLIYA